MTKPQERNFLLKPETSIKYGNDLTAGKNINSQIILESTQKIIANGLLDLHLLMRNLALLYYYAPYMIDVRSMILKSMIEVAKKSDISGTVNFQIVRLMFDSQFSLALMALKEGSHKEVIDQIFIFMAELVNPQDKKDAEMLRNVMKKALKGNEDYEYLLQN